MEMAEFICKNIPSVEMIRMVNSGTEAVMSAIRVARGYTRRNKIVKFAGCYHGHSDALLVKAGSGVMTAGVPDSAGVPAGCTQDTLTAVYNDLSSVKALFEQFPDQIAAVIVEPVAANMGVVLPEEGFLQGCRLLRQGGTDIEQWRRSVLCQPWRGCARCACRCVLRSGSQVQAH